jgi:thioredoxin reductase (NADPH)
MFPLLTQEMASRIVSYGAIEHLAAGTDVFKRHQRGVDWFVVLDGSIEIFDLDPHGTPHLVTTHHKHQFTGELDLFNDREVLLSGRTAAATEVIRVKRPDFRRLVSSETDIAEILMRAFILRRVGIIRLAHGGGGGGVVLVGSGRSGDTLRLERFLTRNAYPHRLLNTDNDAEASSFLQCLQIEHEQLPVVVVPGEPLLRNPPTAILADTLGLTEVIDGDTVWDVAVVGAGPAGLAAAVYAASEGLRTIVVEGLAPGGQAGTSSKIENYLGFPTGISGQALAGRAQVQAQKFGARLAIARAVTAIDCQATPYRLELEDRQRVTARAVIIATGARYRKLDVPDYDKYEGQGIQYAATGMEAQLCTGEVVVVVGGGNSAGQAAVFLSRTVAHVHILVRAGDLAATMSDYLVQRILSSPKITLHARSEITALGGGDSLREVTWTNRDDGKSQTHTIASLFVMIGAEPNSEWLGGCLELDSSGFILTGQDSRGQRLGSSFVTTRPGIFAVGDVRSGSVKRVASGVGEGSVVVQSVHQFLNPVVA